MIFLTISIVFIVGAFCALYTTIRLIGTEGINGGIENNITLIMSIGCVILSQIFSYGFYKMFSENLTFIQVFG